jgi:long-chain acyl-CoA synthetase
LGRKSEVIVTSAGVNLHPEDLEAAIEQEPSVAACAVVAMETANGPEPCAVLAMRGAGDGAAAVIERANQRLAEFQQMRRWVLWPEPDLPRTSSGKVRRKAVAAWLAGIMDADENGAAAAAGAGAFGASGDWLLALIAEITGERPRGVGDEQRLSEDLLLDSLGRVQLAAVLEERLGSAPELDEARTLGELRGMVAGAASTPTHSAEERGMDGARADLQDAGPSTPLCSAQDDRENEIPARIFEQTVGTIGTSLNRVVRTNSETVAELGSYIYPRWPWLRPFQWLRVAFIEAVERPLVWLLANPQVVAPELLANTEPMLIIANHVTAYDGPLIHYALPGALRRRMAVAMARDMLEDYRHFRNPESSGWWRRFYLPGPLIWLLLTALFNVFPLPRRRNFQCSFAHAGAALDHGYNVLVFPEGTRSAAGELARFRGGIGLLVKQSGAAVLPVGLRGLGELKAAGRGWFRSGRIEAHVGAPIRFGPEESEAAITERLHGEVERLVGTKGLRD